MSRRGYNGYRGRSAAQDVLKVILGLLVAVLVLALVGLMIGQRYIIYTDNGVRLELPFFQREEAPPADTSVPVDIVQLPAVSKPESDAQPEYDMRAVRMTLEELQTGGAAAVQALNANTVVVDMKGEDGRLAYVSQQPLGQNVDAGEVRVTQLLSDLHREGVRVVARVSCFRDHALGGDTRYALLTNSGYVWCYDEAKLNWTNPAYAAVRDYVVGVVGELAKLGFDEVLLDHCGYPTQGNLEWIRTGENYDQSRLSEYIGDVLTRAAQAVEGTETTLSVLTTRSVLDGNDRLSGQTAEKLAQLSGRVWLTEDGQTDLNQLAEQAGIDPDRLVHMGLEFSDETTHQSILFFH